MVGSKGGIAVCFKILGKSFIFINSHLCAGKHKIIKRNRDFNRIEVKLALPKNYLRMPAISNKIRTSDRFDFCFWMEDLNYRINGTLEVIKKMIDKNYVEVLLFNDQLFHERLQGKTAKGFKEGMISFAPTYKYDTIKEEKDLTYAPKEVKWDTSKKLRHPAWTDRIMFKAKDFSKISLKNYESIPTIKLSDHRPVFA